MGEEELKKRIKKLERQLKQCKKGKKGKRAPSAYNKCLSNKLKGKMSGKTKTERASLFKAAAAACKQKKGGD